MLMRPSKAKAEGRRGKQVVTFKNKNSDAEAEAWTKGLRGVGGALKRE